MTCSILSRYFNDGDATDLIVFWSLYHHSRGILRQIVEISVLIAWLLDPRLVLMQTMGVFLVIACVKCKSFLTYLSPFVAFFSAVGLLLLDLLTEKSFHLWFPLCFLDFLLNLKTHHCLSHSLIFLCLIIDSICYSLVALMLQFAASISAWYRCATWAPKYWSNPQGCHHLLPHTSCGFGRQTFDNDIAHFFNGVLLGIKSKMRY